MQTGTFLKAAMLVTTLTTLSANTNAQTSPPGSEVSGASVEAIAEEAFLYGLPMVMMYNIMNEYAINEDSGQYKAPFNTIANVPRVYTPADTAVVTPNSDTPYSFVWMDLRAEPMVLCVPEIPEGRYYSVMLTSLYTFNFGYIGSRTTGNGAGCYAVAGPSWEGTLPSGIDKLFTSETDFALAMYRTQLFDPSDIDNVKAIQAQFRAQTLSVFLGSPRSKPTAAVRWPEIDRTRAITDLYEYLAFLLAFAPPTGSAAVEIPLREKFAQIGIRAGRAFNTIGLNEADKTALATAGKHAEEAIREDLATTGTHAEGWTMITSGIGDRAVYDGDWTHRAAVAVGGILANDPAEASYAITRQDKDEQPLDGSSGQYTLTFAEDAMPPVNAFWSITIYDGKTQLLVKNPINRYLINSAMLADLQRNADGSLTLYIQKDEPTDAAEKANWLPAPNGPIYLVLRLYWPKNEVLDGRWLPPGIQKLP